MSDNIQIEAVRGLPALPPEGETILWQGAPDIIALARQALCADWIVAYFAALALWRGIANGSQDGFAVGMTTASWYAVIGAIVVSVLVLVAWAMARSTVYTLTSHRVAMRVGAALPITLNLPYRWIGSADLVVQRDGTGTIALDLRGDTRLSYLVLWPHVQPWRINRARPALRCIPGPRQVGAILGRAAAAQVIEDMPGRSPAARYPIAAE